MDERNQQRYVAFFDMLGFKEAVKRDVDEAWGALEDLRVSMQEVLNLFTKNTHSTLYIPSSVRTQATNFSDSILVFTLDDKPEDLHLILISSAELFSRSLHRRVPLRGGISHGRFYVNFEKNLFCGFPLIRAHKLGQNAQWSGIIVDDNVAAKYSKNPITAMRESTVMKWVIPVKGTDGVKPEERWVFKWPLTHRNNFTVGAPISAAQYSKAFERLFLSSYEDWPKRIQVIYDTTVKFVNLILKVKGA